MKVFMLMVRIQRRHRCNGQVQCELSSCVSQVSWKQSLFVHRKDEEEEEEEEEEMSAAAALKQEKPGGEGGPA
ncbi:hypothetical protein JOB18_036285 [Solea senegalensis]|uniref:Uncharacterized protein n=1 Tax=Solea senegalensis TaxID=28829 RepID=A0AAV6SIQ3_SOLSE|nr:hypothetical protein JOB18_036285 [Solea senegalensis]